MNDLAPATNAVYERARLSRDARFDGRFFVGVRTTGIYCRPICPANAPNSDNVAFFPTAAAASEAGYRPCLRCRPECAPGTPAWAGTSTTVQRALRLIGEGALEGGNIEALAERVGVTSRHLRRLFAQHVGASPLAVAHTQRLHFAKRLIDQTNLPLKDVSIAAGFGSVRRFNDTFQKTYGRSPGQLRKGRGRSSQGRALGLLLPYREPFGWQQLLAFFAARATAGVECVAGDRYRRTVEVGNARGVIEVTDAGGSLLLAVHGIPTDALFIVVQRVRGMFDVDAPIDEITRTLRCDPQLRDWLRDNPGLRVPGAWDGWELTVRAILGQQVSVKAATTFAGRLAGKYSDDMTPDGPAGMPRRLFPSPARLARARLETIGVVRSRAQSIRDLARAVVAGKITFDAAQPVDDFCRALTAVRGIGDWTAEYVALRALKNPNAFPATDLGLLRAFDGVNGHRLRPHELEARAEPWRPWRAYAALLAWGSAGGAGG